MKIAVINGSKRKGRKSIFVSRYVADQLNNMGHTPDFLDVGEYNFPVMVERFRFLDNPPARMKEFSERMFEASGIIIVTPEYNGSYAGSLKNTLDYFKPEYERKSMGLVTVSAGKMGGVNAMHHLQAWAIHVKGIVSPYKLLVDRVEEKFDEDGRLKDESFEDSVNGFLDNFLWLTNAIY